MWILTIFLMLADDSGRDHSTMALRVQRFESYAACDRARWDWFERGAIPAGAPAPQPGLHWEQFTPGACEPAPAIS